jgi:hypothetical protein
MTNENDRKDEDQPQDRYYQICEAWLWALALFVSTIFVAVVTGFVGPRGGGYIWAFGVIIYIGIPASVIGFILGLFFGAPRLTNSAKRFERRRFILVILCLGYILFLFWGINYMIS